MRKRTVKILKIIAIVLVVLSLIYAIAVGVTGAKLRRVYADLKADGRPMKQADVIPPEVPDTENAALLYESAILLLKAQSAPEGNLLDYLGRLSDKLIKEPIEQDKLEELQQLIKQDVVNQALSIAEQGTQRRLSRFDRDYNAGINMLMPSLSHFRQLTCILSAKALLEAQAGNLDNAWDIARIQLRFADASLTEPIIVPQLVRIAIIRMACRTIQELCEIAPPNDQQYRSIQKLLSDFDDIAPIVLAIDGERLLFGEWAFNLLENGSAEDLKSLSSSVGSGFGGVLVKLYAAFKPLFLADRAAYMRLMHKSIELIEDPYSPENANVIEKEVQKYHMLTSMLVPAMFRVKEIHCEMTAELRITQIGLALLQHKQNRDTFPDTLETLKPQNINDPFSEQPIRYKSQRQGFILYSVGPDQKDNGGSPRQKKQKDNWDIVWSYTGTS